MSKKKTNERPIIETYKGFEVSVDIDTSRFHAENKTLDVEYERSSVWELRHAIDESKWQAPKNKQAIIVWPRYDNDRLAKITVIRENLATKCIEFKIDAVTCHLGFDVGKTESDDHIKLYPLSENNLKIWDELWKIEQQIGELEARQEPLARKLSLK